MALEDGTVYTWGWGGNAVTGGALGQGQWEDSPLPRPVAIAPLTQRKIVSISAGYQHTVALDCTHASLLLLPKLCRLCSCVAMLCYALRCAALC
jgi:hypothetical protein